MAQQSASSVNQNMGSPGQLIFSFQNPNLDPGVPPTTVSFSPALAKIIQPQFAPIQRVHVAENGSIHVFQISTNEELTWQVDFDPLPWDDNDGTMTAGFRSLREFIRTSLNYSQYPFTVTSPDGDIETMRYLVGLDTFKEATGISPRHLRWTGTISLRRVLAP